MSASATTANGNGQQASSSTAVQEGSSKRPSLTGLRGRDMMSLDEDISRRSGIQFLSVLDVFKVGVGPSSSHTMGPMVAAGRFLDVIRQSGHGGTGPGAPVSGLRVTLYGSLAFTGAGHATDRAAVLGLAGFQPATYDAELAERALAEIAASKAVSVPGLPTAMRLDPLTDVVFNYGPPLPGHANGLVFQALDASRNVLIEVSCVILKPFLKR